MNRLKGIASTHKKIKYGMFVAAIVVSIAIVLQSYFLVKVVDSIFMKQASMNEVLPYLGGLFIMFLLRTIFSYWKDRLGIQLATKVKRQFRNELLGRYAKASFISSKHGTSGGKVSMLLDAVDAVDSYFSSYLPQVIQTTFIPILVLIVVFTQHVNSGLIMLITAPFIPIFMIIIGMKTQSKSEEQMEQLQAFSGKFLDALQGLLTLRIYGQSKKQQKVTEKNSLGFRDATMEILKVAFAQSFMLEVVTMLSIGIVALELAIQLIIYQSLSFFTAFFVLVLVPEYFVSLKNLGTTFHNGRTSMGAAQKIIDELNKEEEQVSWGGLNLNVEGPPAITLNHVGFHYGENQFSLKDVSANIPPYSQVAIVGKSGSGKSTLLHLIAGLVQPTEGTIQVNHQSLHEHKEEEWFQQIGYITQHPYLYSGTIAENIAIGQKESASMIEIQEAAQKAGLHELILTLENGYDTLIGEAGRGLSGGEKQRLALARVFLKQPSIILFDEPTTGLDVKTERILQSSIKKLASEATIITVAHRLHTIKDADTILLLENGRLAATGTHQELLDTVLSYKEMVSVQRGGSAS